jgi:protocatechuate 3,4-dioxygenase beta subunit
MMPLASLQLARRAISAETPVPAAANASSATDESLAPTQVVALDLDLAWRPSSWSWKLNTERAWIARENRTTVFTIDEPNRRKIWVHYLSLPIDTARYPIVVMKYVATNTLPVEGRYMLWLDDGTGPDFGQVAPFQSKDIVGDGQAHEVSFDLRNTKVGGGIIGMALAIDAGAKSPTSFELISLRFESAEKNGDVVPQAQTDPELSVSVIDERGTPVVGAEVIVDAERLNFARRARTDGSGVATVRPLSNATGKHMVRVNASGMARADELANGAKIQVRLARTERYGGRVTDEQGQPIEGATVLLLNRRQIERAVTDGDGKWLSPPMSSVGKVRLRVVHSRYYSTQVYDDSITRDRLLDGSAVCVLKKGINVRGTIVNPEGKPVSNAEVLLGESVSPSSCAFTDEQGSFEFGNAPPGPMLLTVQAKGYSPLLVDGKAESQMMPVRLSLEKPHTLRLLVQSSAGVPIAGARIDAEEWRGKRTIDWATHTSANGLAEWTDAPAEPIRYRITLAGFVPTTVTLEPQKREQVVVLNPLANAGAKEASQ